MKSYLRTTLIVLAFGAIAVAPAIADTLELRNGKLVTGKFLGGTQSQIRFEVAGKVEVFAVDQVLALTFTSDSRASEEAAPYTPPAPANTAVVAPAPANTSPAAPGTVTVPAGTSIMVRLIDGVDSEKNAVGDRFRASLEENLYVGETLVAPKGTDVYGRLAEVKEAGRISGKSQLRLELTGILINQKIQPILTGDYDVAGSSRGSDSAKKIGGGAAIGAIIGAIAGGGKGAAIGAGVGAGAGTAVQVFTKGEQVRVPSETLLEFRLEQPFTATPSRSAPR